VRCVLICARLAMISGVAIQAGGVRQTEAVSSQREWHAMGNAPCAWSDPLTKADGNLDIDGTIHALQAGRFTCNVFVITGSAGNSDPSFQKFLSAADKAKIDTWSVLIPPSEGSNSLPYRSDYVKWMKDMGELSLVYTHFRGVDIDDIDQGISPEIFTRSYLCKIYRTKQAANPQLQFVPAIYDLDRTVADRLAGCVDGVWLWWVNLEKATGLPSFLKNSKLAANGRFPVYGGIYAHWTSWHKSGNPVPAIFQETLRDSCSFSDGAVIWRISLDPSDPLLGLTRAFLPGGASSSAKCGLADTETHDKTHQVSQGLAGDSPSGPDLE
jgi:hypothetical protein